MLLALIASLALVLSNGPRPSGSEPNARLSSSAWALPPDRYPQLPLSDPQAEQHLLALVNQARAEAGERPLELDPNLSWAAQAHAAAIAARRELSHQLPGEPPLGLRLASPGRHMDSAGENVAFDVDLDQAHQNLMTSPAHRENLLNPHYNVVGLAVASSDDRLYVVEDFGHSVRTYPAGQAENMVASAVERERVRLGRSPLRRLEAGSLRNRACSMATQDQLNPKAVQGVSPHRYVLTYTSLEPQLLPAGAEAPLGQNSLRSFAVGACYAQTPTYPNGAYFTALAFY